MTNRFSLTLLLALAALEGTAQPKKFKGYFDVSLFAGGAQYTGDLNPRLFHSPTIKPGLGLIAKRNFSRRWAYKVALHYGTVYGNDAYGIDEFSRQRNLSFQSRIWEASFQMEFNFLPYQMGNPEIPATPYIFAGIGGFFFNPYRTLGNATYFLNNLHTEGQTTSASANDTYSLVQPCIPFGLGLRANLGRKMAIGIEWGLRRTFTDYLDDVSDVYTDGRVLYREVSLPAEKLSGAIRKTSSQPGNFNRQRGNNWNQDWYSFFGILLVYKIPNGDSCPELGN
jgi:hypothetical protein